MTAKEKTKEFKRPDGRKPEETRPMGAKVGVIPNADGSAMFSFGDTVAIAAVYGPKQMHPQHAQNPEKGVLRCNYNMLSFSVSERIAKAFMFGKKQSYKKGVKSESHQSSFQMA